jgi:nicotinate-nucleotide adenylyltransferase
MRIGIMGGSFDPIHTGHLIVAEQMRDARQLDQVIFIPTKVPPHKSDRMLASSSDRLKMARLAVADHPGFEVSDIELRREGPSYSIDTIAELREKWRNEHRVFFIVGADTLAELPTWRRPGDLVDHADFLTAMRPGFPMDFWDDLSVTFSPEQLARLKQGCVDTIPVGISSTVIRQRVSEGKTIRYLVPDAVEKYIHQHGLYGAKKGKPK